MIWIVLGMHKSGTTLVSRMLHDSGISMIDDCDDVGDYDSGNKMERVSTKYINNLILSSFGKFSLDIQNFSPSHAEGSIKASMAMAVDDCNRTEPDWGFKDPRTCLTYGLWDSVLPEHSIIAVFRSPEEVWSHYWVSARFYRKFSVFFKFVSAWTRYNSSIISILKKTTQPYIVFEYSKLMSSDQEFQRLQGFINHQIKDSRDSRLYRARMTGPVFYSLACFIHRLKGGVSPDLIQATLLRMSLDNHPLN